MTKNPKQFRLPVILSISATGLHTSQFTYLASSGRPFNPQAPVSFLIPDHNANRSDRYTHEREFCACARVVAILSSHTFLHQILMKPTAGLQNSTPKGIASRNVGVHSVRSQRLTRCHDNEALNYVQWRLYCCRYHGNEPTPTDVTFSVKNTSGSAVPANYSTKITDGRFLSVLSACSVLPWEIGPPLLSCHPRSVCISVTTLGTCVPDPRRIALKEFPIWGTFTKTIDANRWLLARQNSQTKAHQRPFLKVASFHGLTHSAVDAMRQPPPSFHRQRRVTAQNTCTDQGWQGLAMLHRALQTRLWREPAESSPHLPLTI